jgi:putative FmdB family regulatory protein
MPTYDYYCKSCDKDIEVFQSITAEPLKVCPECDKKGKITRKISGGSGIIFKGSGFYETDYKAKRTEGSSEKASAAQETKQPNVSAKSETSTKSDTTKD